MERIFGRESFRTYSEGIRREWVITNGMGGYAGSSIIGANTRKHHGLLIASFHAPTERYVLVNRIKEEVIIGRNTYGLYAGKEKAHAPEEGFLNQSLFSYEYVPSFTYRCGGVTVNKTLAYEWNRNTVSVLYKIENGGGDAVISLSPVFNFRDHNSGSRKKDLKFTVSKEKNGISLVPDNNREVKINMYVGEGVLIPVTGQDSFDSDIELQTEIDTGMSSADTGYIPVRIEIGIKAGEKKEISVVFSAEDSYEKNAALTIKREIARKKALVKASGVKTDFEKDLVSAADNFVTYRESTGGKTILAGLPWFTDWGRDTMISLTGLTLVTKRFEDAESILKTFVTYERNGLLPNMFPDTGMEPIYNTADASLWFFYCVHKYLEYKNSEEACAFVRDNLYGCMKKIITSYRDGTDYSIGMDRDGLIRAGSDLDQVTWMDVRVGDRVMTPRHGKPVEINALWFNALKVTKRLADIFGDDQFRKECTRLLELVEESFVARFYNEETGCLNDVVDEVTPEGIRDNAQIRPNQIWAVSLPYSPLNDEISKKVVGVVYEKLFTDFGLRTLNPEDPDYHGLYKGELMKRDEAYHQGTAWAFIMGGFITAFLKVMGNNPEARAQASDMLKPLKQHLSDGCIGGIAEVFDGDTPHISGGCYSQAWSVGETLRAVYEGGLSV